MRTKQERPQPAYPSGEPEGYEGLMPADAGRAAARAVADLSGKELQGVVSVAATEEEWVVSVEVVEDRRIPSSNDMLGVYEVRLDPDGELLSYHRNSRYLQGRPDVREGGYGG